MNSSRETFRYKASPGRERGFTLVELMVAVAIGLFLVSTVGVLFVNSKRTYLAQDANARIQEGARYAADYLGRQARESGYLNIVFNQLSAANLFAAPAPMSFTGTPIAGTEGGASADTITLSSDSTTDCLGKTVASPAINLFRINASKQLECLGNGSGTPGVVLEDVEDMQILYGQPMGSNYGYVVASSAAMSTVTSIRVCLLLRAQADANKRGVDAGQTYMDCSGTAQTKSDGFLRRTMTMTIDLRNRLQ